MPLVELFYLLNRTSFDFEEKVIVILGNDFNWKEKYSQEKEKNHWKVENTHFVLSLLPTRMNRWLNQNLKQNFFNQLQWYCAEKLGWIYFCKISRNYRSRAMISYLNVWSPAEINRHQNYQFLFLCSRWVFNSIDLTCHKISEVKLKTVLSVHVQEFGHSSAHVSKTAIRYFFQFQSSPWFFLMTTWSNINSRNKLISNSSCDDGDGAKNLLAHCILNATSAELCQRNWDKCMNMMILFLTTDSITSFIPKLFIISKLGPEFTLSPKHKNKSVRRILTFGFSGSLTQVRLV